MGLDPRSREDLNRWLRKARVYLGTFLAGGFVAVAYTYSLDAAKDRKIEQLQDRLQNEAIRFSDLEGEFRAVRDRVESQVDREAFDELQQELAGATSRQGGLETKLGRADRKIRELEKVRGSWRVKFAKLETGRDDLALELLVAKADLSAAEALAKKRARTPDSSARSRVDSIAGGPGTGGPVPANTGSLEARGDSRRRSSRPAIEATRGAAD